MFPILYLIGSDIGMKKTLKDDVYLSTYFQLDTVDGNN